MKWANGFIVVFSIVNRESYDEATRYLDQLNKHRRQIGTELPIVLVGNKADLERYRYSCTYRYFRFSYYDHFGVKHLIYNWNTSLKMVVD